MSEEECVRLYETVKAIRPSASVEVGFAQGISTLAILQALHENGHGHHHVIDPFQKNFGNCGLAMVEKSGLGDRFTFHEKFAEDVIPSLPRLQFAFIDSSHLFDRAICEFVLADKRLDVGGLIGFHDLWMPSLQGAVRFILTNRAYTVHGPQLPKPDMQGRFFTRAARMIANHVPGRDHIFAGEFLKPWRVLGIANMVLLQKNADDNRHWNHHNAF
ncbi:MAG: class I SAM-dependent methyltransferase [Chthoniobacteraceae bacterium]